MNPARPQLPVPAAPSQHTPEASPSDSPPNPRPQPLWVSVHRFFFRLRFLLCCLNEWVRNFGRGLAWWAFAVGLAVAAAVCAVLHLPVLVPEAILRCLSILVSAFTA